MSEVIDSFRGEYFFLSNFYQSPFEFNGLTYNNAEAAFQAQKSTSSAKSEWFAKLSPKDAKREGRKLLCRPDWEIVKYGEMYKVLTAKFAPGTELAEKLLATGNAELIEGNTWGDTCWGRCNGVGLNALGYVLMRVRNDLKLNKENKNKENENGNLLS